MVRTTSISSRCLIRSALRLFIMAAMALWIGFSVFSQTENQSPQRGARCQPAEEKAKEMTNPPSEAQLGTPIYPGAVFDAKNSAGMSMSGQTFYIFYSTDLPKKVADFYSQKLGIKATSYDPGKYMIPLKGDLPLPDKGITIETNQGSDPKYKTVISYFSPSS